jgi:hypothetical protein
MSAVLSMRDRLAAALQIELRNRGLPAGADIVFAVADRTLEATQFEALTESVGAVESGGDPAGARDRLIDDGGFTDIIRLDAEVP